MLSHTKIWTALDELAKRHGLSPSGLARLAGLDPTSFNPSKRTAKDGRARWPSTESLAKVLDATEESFDTFAQHIAEEQFYRQDAASSVMPMIGLEDASAPGVFDSGGFPAGQGWDEMAFPNLDADGAYGLEVAGDGMLPLYRDGDIIIVSPGEKMRRGDRVIVCTWDGQVQAKLLHRQSNKVVELRGLDGKVPGGELKLAREDVSWLVKIIWASQ